MERMTNDTPYWEERLSERDTISRQAAIDAFWELDIELRPSAIDAITCMLQELPPAQPEILACGEGELNVLDTNVADCSDCIKHGGDWDCDHVHCHKGKSAQPHGREKLVRPIDADMAIDAIQKDRETSWKELENDDTEYRNGCDDGYAYSMQIISELPSVERKGKWIVDDVATEHCSVCKHRFYISALFTVGGNDEPPCCPNCGARMEVTK